MLTPTRRRFQLFEYGPSVDLTSMIVAVASVDRERARRLIEVAGERAAKTLRFKYNPLQTEAGNIRAIDFAGMIRLGPSLELEIVPKFLGLSETQSRWREDFYFLANLSRHGRLLASERLWASGQAPKDLATLVARSLAGMYWDNRRRPLRSYRRMRVEDVFIDGEVDPVDIRFPTPDGFVQEIIRYDRSNAFNAAIQAAAKELLPEIGDSEAASGLIRIVQDLPAQKFNRIARKRPVPGRARSWQPVIDLSHDVLEGFGLSYSQGYSTAPGYVLGTWQVWEDLLTIAVRLVYGSLASSQKEFHLGLRTSAPSGSTSNVRVYPDLTIVKTETSPRFMIDAKYKTNSQKGGVRISEADIYEALAFANAASCDNVILAYPALATEGSRELGSVATFEILRIDSVRIFGVQVEVRGISKRQGLKTFSERLKADLQRLL